MKRKKTNQGFWKDAAARVEEMVTIDKKQFLFLKFPLNIITMSASNYMEKEKVNFKETDKRIKEAFQKWMSRSPAFTPLDLDNYNGNTVTILNIKYGEIAYKSRGLNVEDSINWFHIFLFATLYQAYLYIHVYASAYYPSLAKKALSLQRLIIHLNSNPVETKKISNSDQLALSNIKGDCIAEHSTAMVLHFNSAAISELSEDNLYIQEAFNQKKLIASETGRQAVIEGKWSRRDRKFNELKPEIDKLAGQGLKHHEIAEKLIKRSAADDRILCSYTTSGGIAQEIKFPAMKELIKGYFIKSDRAHLISGRKKSV